MFNSENRFKNQAKAKIADQFRNPKKLRTANRRFSWKMNLCTCSFKYIWKSLVLPLLMLNIWCGVRIQLSVCSRLNFSH